MSNVERIRPTSKRHPRAARQHRDHPNALRRAEYAKNGRWLMRRLDRGETVEILTDTHRVFLRKPVAA